MELRDYVEQYKNGRQDAFDEIFLRTKDDFYRYAYFVAGKNEALINDAMQDTYIQILNSIDRLDDPDKFVPWGKTILRNKIYAFYRKNGKELSMSQDEDEEGAGFFDRLEDQDESLMPGNELDREEVRSIIRDVVRSLPEKQRVVVCLYYLDEMSVADIAAYLQISEGTVKSRLYKAREAIRARIEGYEKKYDVRLHALVLPFALLHKSLTHLPKDFQMSDASSNAVYHGCKSSLGKKAGAAAGASALGAGAAAAGTVGRAAGETHRNSAGNAADAAGKGNSAHHAAEHLERRAAEKPQRAVKASRGAEHPLEHRVVNTEHKPSSGRPERNSSDILERRAVGGPSHTAGKTASPLPEDRLVKRSAEAPKQNIQAGPAGRSAGAGAKPETADQLIRRSAGKAEPAAGAGYAAGHAADSSNAAPSSEDRWTGDSAQTPDAASMQGSSYAGHAEGGFAAGNPAGAHESAPETVSRLMKESGGVPAPEHVTVGRAARREAAKRAGRAGQTAAKGAAKAAGKAGNGAAKKIIASVIALALAAGGGFGGYLWHAYSNAKTHPKQGVVSAGKHSAVKTDKNEPAQKNSQQTDSQTSENSQSDSSSSDNQSVMNQYDKAISELLSNEEKLENDYKEEHPDEVDPDDGSNTAVTTPQSYFAKDYDGDGVPDLIAIDTKNYDADGTATTNVILNSPSGVQVIRDKHPIYNNDTGERISVTSDNKTVRLAFFGDSGSSELTYSEGREYTYQLSPNDHKTMIYLKSSGTDSDSSSAIKEKYVNAPYAHRICLEWDGDSEAKDVHSYKSCDELRSLLQDSGFDC